MTNPESLTNLRAQMAAMTNPESLTNLRAQMAAMTNPESLTNLRAQMAAMTNPESLTNLRAQMAAMISSGGMQSDFSAAISSYHELISEWPLASFLVSPGDLSKASTQTIETEELNLVAPDLDNIHGVDLEIVKALSVGDAELSLPAIQRLQSIYLQIIVIWDILLRMFNTYIAIGILVALMSTVSKPVDISRQVSLLPDNERALLAGYRIVNRNGARLRVEPSKSSELIVSLPLGLLVEVLDKNDKGWFYVAVEYQGEWIEGWVYFSVTTPVPPPQGFRKHEANS